MNTLELNKNILDPFKKWVFEYDKEVCCNIRKMNPSSCELVIDIKSIVYGNENENKCQHKEYSSIIFHTHYKDLLSYPSEQDILKVFKHSDRIKYNYLLYFYSWCNINRN